MQSIVHGIASWGSTDEYGVTVWGSGAAAHEAQRGESSMLCVYRSGCRTAPMPSFGSEIWLACVIEQSFASWSKMHNLLEKGEAGWDQIRYHGQLELEHTVVGKPDTQKPKKQTRLKCDQLYQLPSL
jgi:hypothetical protein